ncbi:MAG TPA: hypothetical protein VG965_04510 [Patescibacteria group bacterium]|nr:hypothetical protein [Patescibacteria group bacterium]
MLEHGFWLSSEPIDATRSAIEEFEDEPVNVLDDISFLDRFEDRQKILETDLESEFYGLNPREQFFFKMGVNLGIDSIPQSELDIRLKAPYIDMADKCLYPMGANRRLQVIIDPQGRRILPSNEGMNINWLENRIQRFSPEYAGKFHRLSASLGAYDRPIFEKAFARTVAPFMVRSEVTG